SASTLRITPRWCPTPAAAAASAHADTTSWDAMAGYSRGTYASGVPSLRTAPVAITRSPSRMPGWPPPHVPTRRNVWTPRSPTSPRGRRGGPADAAGARGHSGVPDPAGEGAVLPGPGALLGRLQMAGDQDGPEGIAGDEHVLADLAGSEADVILALLRHGGEV